MWNPFSEEYTPVRNPVLRTLAALALLPVQLLFQVAVWISMGLDWLLSRMAGEK